jgi:hypothetical protein
MNTRILSMMIFSAFVISACTGSDEAVLYTPDVAPDISGGGDVSPDSGSDSGPGVDDVDSGPGVDDVVPDATEVPFSFEDFGNRCLVDDEINDDCLEQYESHCLDGSNYLVEQDVCTQFFVKNCEKLDERGMNVV